MFVGRESELERLNEMYAGGKFEFAVVYGRRRVGKTTLITEFCRDKDAIFFSSLESSAEMNLAGLSAALGAYLEPDGSSFPVYSDYTALFERVARLAADKRIILVIDEYPWLAESERAVSSILQHMIDHRFSGGRLFLILCGSSMSFMERQVLGGRSPLYGRRTAQFKLAPLSYREAAPLTPARSAEEKAMIYGVTGGIPLYTGYFAGDGGFGELMASALLRRDAPLLEEPANLLKQELRGPAAYAPVIAAIAGGASRLNEIATKSALDTSACSQKLNALSELGIVEKLSPVGERGGRRTIYALRDMLYRFWYHFMPSCMAMVQRGCGMEVWNRIVEPAFPTYMGKVFEAMCAEYIFANAAALPVFPAETGSWWGGDPKTRRQEEIDLVAIDASGKSSLFAECKYTNAPVGAEVLNTLIRRSSLLREDDKKYYALFSKSGFTSELQKRAGKEGIILVTLEDMYR